MVRKNYRDVYRKGRVIQAWRGINLYNLAHFREPRTINKTFYQQKWQAKSLARTYHGRQVREKQWQLMFNRKIPAMVDMNARHLARDDGSIQAAGRGSGRDDPNWMEKRTPLSTPYMSMTFWPLERRLDTAIFRAMFASSVRTARQFVIHGHVKVNGKKIKYPGYLLNPGDMFSVDPDMVMYSTGMRDSAGKRKWILQNLPSDAPQELKLAKPKNNRADEPAPSKKAADAAADGTDNAAPTEEAASSAIGSNKLKAELKKLDEKISEYLKPNLGKGYVFRTRRKQRLYKLRELRRQVREAIKAASSESDDASDKQLNNFNARLERSKVIQDPVRQHLEQLHPPPESKIPPITHLELLKSWPNARRQDKPYLTPWTPRNWMSAFAFIPRYLEVNQNVCSAVYLRHPVARSGYAEVPSPYSKEMGLLAYQWYLRRR